MDVGMEVPKSVKARKHIIMYIAKQGMMWKYIQRLQTGPQKPQILSDLNFLLWVFFLYTLKTMMLTTTKMILTATRANATGIVKSKGVEDSASLDDALGVFSWQTGCSPSCRNTLLYFKVSKEAPSMTSLDSFSTHSWRCFRMVVLLDLLVPKIWPERISHLSWQRGSSKNKKCGVKSHLHVLSRFIVILSPREFSLLSIRKSCTKRWDLGA